MMLAMPLLLEACTPTTEAFRIARTAAFPPPTVSAWLTARYVFDEMPHGECKGPGILYLLMMLASAFAFMHGLEAVWKLLFF